MQVWVAADTPFSPAWACSSRGSNGRHGRAPTSWPDEVWGPPRSEQHCQDGGLAGGVATVAIDRVSGCFPTKAVADFLQALGLFVAALGFLSFINGVLVERGKSFIGVVVSFGLVRMSLDSVGFEPSFSVPFGSFDLGWRKLGGVGNGTFDAFG